MSAIDPMILTRCNERFPMGRYGHFRLLLDALGQMRNESMMSAFGRGCVKTPRQSHPRSRLQTQRETLLTGLRADIALLVSN